MISQALLNACLAAVSYNETSGIVNPNSASFAEKGTSRLSFGQSQGDVGANGLARQTLNKILIAYIGSDTADQDDQVNRLMQEALAAHTAADIPADDLAIINAALASPNGIALTTTMDNINYKHVIDGLDSLDSNNLADSGFIAIACWINMTGAPTTFARWTQGNTINLSNGTTILPSTTTPIDSTAVLVYLEKQLFFVKDPENFPHYKESVNQGLTYYQNNPA